MTRSIIRYTALSAVLLLLLPVVTGCRSCGTKPEEREPDMFELREADKRVLDEIRQAERIFRSMPSPLESAMLIRQAEARFDRSILNPVENASNYTTTRSMALNLGIYTCNLSYAGLYDQTRIIIDYMEAAKRMAEGLGIMDAVSEEAVQRLEENINNKEIIMDVVAETFMNSSSYLEDNEQTAIAALVLTGGWIEGLYIATQLVDMSEFEDNMLVSTIIDQKLSIGILAELLDENRDMAAIEEVAGQIDALKAIFDKITLTSTPISTEVDRESNVTILRSEVQADITPEIFIELREAVADIRNSFIK